jgi:hypothetical protein
MILDFDGAVSILEAGKIWKTMSRRTSWPHGNQNPKKNKEWITVSCHFKQPVQANIWDVAAGAFPWEKNSINNGHGLSSQLCTLEVCSNEATMLVPHHLTLLDTTCWPHLNTMLDDVLWIGLTDIKVKCAWRIVHEQVHNLKFRSTSQISNSLQDLVEFIKV